MYELCPAGLDRPLSRRLGLVRIFLSTRLGSLSRPACQRGNNLQIIRLGFGPDPSIGPSSFEVMNFRKGVKFRGGIYLEWEYSGGEFP